MLGSFQKYLTPKYFYQVCCYGYPILGIFFMVSLALGLYLSLVVAPLDYQQGQAFRMIYVHVPAAWMSLLIYSLIFIFSVIYLIWQIKVADLLAELSAPIGASYTFLALFSGALWGKPMWGTFWVWDARLTCELILLFIYFGYMGLGGALAGSNTRGKMLALFAIVGMVDIPLVHFSVQWWQTLHQGPSLIKFAKPSMPMEMLVPLLIMMASFFIFYIFILCLRAKVEILNRESQAKWVYQVIGNES